MSRINYVDINEEKFDDDAAEKELDPWEDEVLLHFLKTSKYLPRSSKKQCKRALNRSKNLIYEGDKLYHRKSPDDVNIKEIPKISDRRNIIKNIHTFGHFGIEKTLKELTEKYYWRGIARDCELVVKSCLSCLRFQKTPILDHAALELPIRQINDRIGMDLVL